MDTLAPVLAPYVESLHVYDVTGDPGVHIGMPSTALTVVLPVGEPLDVAWAGRPETRRLSWAQVSGLHAGPAAITHGGRQRGVFLGLTLRGARALLGVPAAALAGQLLDLGDVDAHLQHLSERLHESEPHRWRAMVEHALVSAVARHEASGPRAEVGRALAQLTRGLPVATVADEVGYSRRHLGDLVRAESGISPKQFQRLARFERSHGLVRDQGRRLTDVAASSGYADQAHLAREWNALAGCSPTEWRRRELPTVQDAAAEAGRG